jgi:phage recombination protein Bet
MKNENEKSIIEFVPFGTKDKIQLTIELVKRLIAVKTKSGKSCSDEDAFKFMLLCQARKLNPFEGDAYLIGYDSQSGPTFSLITSHQAFLKRAELNPEYDGMESGTIVLRNGEQIDLIGDWHMPNDNILGGWAKVFFKSRSHPMHKRVRLARFNKNYGIWRDDPAGMITKCAEADALRSSFPTMLGGLYTHEEMAPTKVEAEIAHPVFQEPASVADNGGKATVETPEPVRAAEVVKEQVKEPKKKELPAALRKSQKAPSAPTEKNAHKRFRDMLAMGNYTPQDFIDLALKEDWLEPDQTKFEDIPEARIQDFMKQDVWEWVMEALEARTAQQNTAAAERGNLL